MSEWLCVCHGEHGSVEVCPVNERDDALAQINVVSMKAHIEMQNALEAEIARLNAAPDSFAHADSYEGLVACIKSLTLELEQWKDAADEQAGPIQALLDERKQLLAEVVQLRARVRELEANGPDPLGGRMDV